MSKRSQEESSKKSKTDQRVLVGLLVALVVAVCLAIGLPMVLFPQEEPLTSDSESVEDGVVRHPLSGMKVSETMEDPQVFAVTVDNHFEAWPPSGVDSAFLVIEAPFEGGVPRLLAFFSEEQDVEKIGPVRSARPYSLDWVTELDALYAHVGGSPEALDQIATGGVFDLNEFWWGGTYFWRSSDRYAPYNTYTSTQMLRDFYLMRQMAGVAPTRLYDTWDFKDAQLNEDVVSRVRVLFSEPVYVVDWEYDVQTGQYLREQYHQPHLTDQDVQISADNVVVVITDMEVLDAVGRMHIRTTGEGEGYLFQDGNKIDVIWKKPSSSERLKFFNQETNEEMLMNAGTTWIEVVPSEERVQIE